MADMLVVQNVDALPQAIQFLTTNMNNRFNAMDARLQIIDDCSVAFEDLFDTLSIRLDASNDNNSALASNIRVYTDNFPLTPSHYHDINVVILHL
jgi:hypothetical protein